MQSPTEVRNSNRGPISELLSVLFHLYLMAALLAGVCLIVVAAFIRASGGSEFALDVIRDLGIGLLVSVFVVVFIEWRAGLTLRKEIAADVLEAVYRRTVPEAIFDQIRDSTFRSDVLRCDWKLDIHVLDVAANETLYRQVRDAAGSEAVYLMEVTVSYGLRNLNDHSINYLVSHGIDLDLCAAESGVPGFTEVKVAKDRFVIDEERRRSLLNTGKPEDQEGISMEKERGNEVLFSKLIELPRSGQTEIRYKLLRAIRAPGIYVLSCATPADGISITINGPENLVFSIRPLHPQGNAIEEADPGHWEFKFGILPWQGIQVVSSPS